MDPTSYGDHDAVATYIVATEETLAAYRRLIRWLSLAYGENIPIFHGPDRASLEDCYTEALAEDDGDVAFYVAGQTAVSRPEPAPPQDWGAVAVETVTVDERGNTIQ